MDADDAALEAALALLRRSPDFLTGVAGRGGLALGVRDTAMRGSSSDVKRCAPVLSTSKRPWCSCSFSMFSMLRTYNTTVLAFSRRYDEAEKRLVNET